VEDKVASLETGVNAFLGKPFSGNELVSVVRSLVRAREATADAVLAQNMDSLEAIAGGLAHEIGNPLNYVKNALATVRRDCQTLMRTVAELELAPPQSATLEKLDARIHKMFEVTEAGVKRIAGTVELMVRYSREGYSRTSQLHDAYAAVRDVVAVVVPTVARQVPVEVELEGDGWIRCVAEEFNQVLTNLIQNALEAVASDGTGRVFIRGRNVAGAGNVSPGNVVSANVVSANVVSANVVSANVVSGSGEGVDLLLSVRDNGPGIPEANRARIFDAFYTTKEVGRGMGMGLTITRRVIVAMGGSLTVKSQVGVGTEFLVRVPSAVALKAVG
jgi:two-component system NtrC family sensor kinase